jgi:UDP-N-acetylglucosamine 1-carboxyvinyltransferase
MFVITQSSNLTWSIAVSGSKNAALPIIAANYITGNKINLSNVPNIADVRMLYDIADESIASSKEYYDLTTEKCAKMRASILMIPYGLIYYKKVKFYGTSGGCKLGKRPLDTFDDALRQCGVQIVENQWKEYTVVWQPNKHIILQEFSVTATEAIITYLVFLQGIDYTIHINQIAIEPHVIDLINFLKKMWARIDLNYDNSLTLTPGLDMNQEFNILHHHIIWDYLEAWLYLSIWACAPWSNLTITGVDIKDLLAVFNVCRAIGIDYKILWPTSFEVQSTHLKNYQATKIQTHIYPWFPTDLQSTFGTILTQCHWVSKIFETLFEARFAYLWELEKLWAKVEILNPHQAIVVWPTKLKWWYVSSPDIRWWSAVILAGILAWWKTYIANEDIILRWYDRIIDKLQSIGVKIIQQD